MCARTSPYRYPFNTLSCILCLLRKMDRGSSIYLCSLEVINSVSSHSSNAPVYHY
ncbi:unnamed protein product [Ectocarpus sp. CCAP 1310/34]|nr:unnamed protein product [Ectocarpus sp. CCAP 1310/34]